MRLLTLAQAGLERYEISNYARPGHESRHNVNYWEGGDYLSAGAHSHHRKPEDPLGERWQNKRLPSVYMRHASEAGDAVPSANARSCDRPWRSTCSPGYG